MPRPSARLPLFATVRAPPSAAARAPSAAAVAALLHLHFRGSTSASSSPIADLLSPSLLRRSVPYTVRPWGRSSARSRSGCWRRPPARRHAFFHSSSSVVFVQPSARQIRRLGARPAPPSDRRRVVAAAAAVLMPSSSSPPAAEPAVRPSRRPLPSRIRPSRLSSAPPVCRSRPCPSPSAARGPHLCPSVEPPIAVCSVHRLSACRGGLISVCAWCPSADVAAIHVVLANCFYSICKFAAYSLEANFLNSIASLSIHP